VVSTRDLFALMRSTALGAGREGTVLDPVYRQQHPVAIAEHFYYPHCPTMAAKYRQNQMAVIAGDRKVVFRGDTAMRYDLASDSEETDPHAVDPSEWQVPLRRNGTTGRGILPVNDQMRGGTAGAIPLR
jgi:hypothetical protein